MKKLVNKISKKLENKNCALLVFIMLSLTGALVQGGHLIAIYVTEEEDYSFLLQILPIFQSST